MSDWQPVNENHAIEVMAAIVTFAEAVPQLAFKKILQASEERAFAAGLKSRHSAHGFQFQLAMDGPPLDKQILGGPLNPQIMSTGAGLVFNALFEDAEGAPLPGRLAEQLRIVPNAILYRTWRYVSWSWQLQRMTDLMTPSIELVKSIVPIGSIRLEYLDRFQFVGPLENVSVRSLLKIASPYLAPHIFDRADLWHTHTGAFLPQTSSVKHLQQVMVDALDEPSPPFPPEKRWVNITTAREDRFSTDDDTGYNVIFPTFEIMHSQLKDLLAEIITDEIASRIFLKGA